MSRLKEVTIDVANDFSDMPYGRSLVDNAFNGKTFRTEHLLKALDEYDVVIVDLTGVMGSGSSFLDEAFAGLIKYEGYRYEDIKKRLIFKSKYQSILNNIEKYMREAKAG